MSDKEQNNFTDLHVPLQAVATGESFFASLADVNFVVLFLMSLLDDGLDFLGSYIVSRGQMFPEALRTAVSIFAAVAKENFSAKM